MKQTPEIEIRECKTVKELTDCVHLQREVFALPELEISPVRHFVVTHHAGGFTLGAYFQEKLVGFTLSVPAILRGEKAFYSHMTAVDKNFQSHGVGAKLKWKQREKSLEEDIKFIKWTFQPVMARNAYFNLEKLGAVIKEYKPNFYGTDYPGSSGQSEKPGLDSDRLFAEWQLESEKVKTLAKGGEFVEKTEIVSKIEIPNDWNNLVKSNPHKAVAEQNRIKVEFQTAFSKNLICCGFERDELHPKFLFCNE
jgi:predicted GNAT superfamily acetyltransferase